MEAGKAESIVSVFLERIRNAPGAVAGFVLDGGNWHDIGSPETYENLTRIPTPED
jgi:NDP-sugar pyrophosphorylase family protein